jgi:transaldolase
MIKVPATPEGIPAIAELIGSGVNVNVTLLFSIDNYRKAVEAFMRGLGKLASGGPTVAGGHAVDKVASVASFFISRIDTAVDAALEEVGNKQLLGTIAIANAKMVYEEFRKLYRSDRWKRLSDQGAQIQRLLWASTGTNNTLYSDTVYVDELIGPDTVITVPPATFNAFLDHGTVTSSLTQGTEKAQKQLEKLHTLGIDLDAITEKLQKDGVEALAKTFESLMANVSEKRDRLSKHKVLT